MNGGEVSTGTVDYLIETFGAEKFASIEPDGFYVYSVPGSMEISAMFRPHAKIEDGRVTGYDEPKNDFYVSEANNCMLLKGDEPHMSWHKYADIVFDVAEKSNVGSIFFVGSVTGMVPHTRDPVFYSSISHESLRGVLIDVDIHATHYEGPSSLATFFIRKAEAHDIPMMTLVAGIPPYVQGTNDHCIEASMEKLRKLAHLDIDMDELSARRIEFGQRLDRIIGKRPQLRDQIQKLEAIYDDQLGITGDEPPESETDSSDLRDWFDKQGFQFDL
jgi:proteasome assembly chaperone (PAC2) family protein